MINTKISKLLSILILSTSSFYLTSSFDAFSAPEAVNSNTQLFTGNIMDGKTQRPIKDVYIKQINTLNTVLTDENGDFSIDIIKDADKKLSIRKEGYETIEYSIQSNDKVQIKLFPITKYDSKKENLPEAHTDVNEVFNFSSRPLSSSFSALYQSRYKATKIPSLTDSSNAITSSGLAINEVAVNGQLRFEKWLANVKVFRSRYPQDLKGFDYNPIYYLDTLQFQVGGGRVFQMSEKMDLYTGLTYLLQFNTPDNRGGSENKYIPYTNSYQDFPQNRQGLGLSTMVGYNFSDHITFTGGGTFYPIIFTSIDGVNKNNLGYHGMLEVGAGIKVETLPGVYIAGNYSNQFFFGFSNFLEDSNFFNIGLSLDPFKMSNISSGK